MTALTEFQRLEAAGSWRPSPDARLREVVVSVGDATLILSDPKSEAPLTHWSLPAVTRLNPGERPAVFAPADDRTDEVLEIDDPLMLQAIDRVRRAIESRRPHPGRLRRGITALSVLAMLLAMLLWLPGATIRYTARIAPPAQADAVAAVLRADIERSTGTTCGRMAGQAVLDRLVHNLLGPKATAHIVPARTGRIVALPNENYVIGRDMVEDQPGPAALAGHLIAASLQDDPQAILRQTLKRAGFSASLHLLTGGQLPADSLSGYGEILLSQHRPDIPAKALTQRFAEISLPMPPYLDTLSDAERAQITKALSQQTANAGHHQNAQAEGSQSSSTVLLNDQQWLALQQICQ